MIGVIRYESTEYEWTAKMSAYCGSAGSQNSLFRPLVSLCVGGWYRVNGMTVVTGTRWVRCIALFKLCKAALLVAVMATSFSLIRHEPARVLTQWALSLHVDPDNYYLHHALAWLLQIDVRHLEFFAVGTGLYALVFAVEGIGLWFLKSWAEYMTILSTAGLLPIEGYELVRRMSITRCFILLCNIAIVVYLVTYVRQKRELHHHGTTKTDHERVEMLP